jgi:hypothetical protein
MGRLARQLTEMQRRITQLERGAGTAQLASSSIEGGALTVNDDQGNPQIILGLQDDGTYAHTATGGTQPPPPSNPVVGAGILGLQVSWDGSMADGTPPLSDFAGVQVHVSGDPAFVPSTATLQSTMIAPGVRPIVGLPAGIPAYVALVTINASGVTSPPSSTIGAQPLAVPDAIPAGSITSGMVAFSITGGGIAVTIGPAPSSPAVGDLWFDPANGYAMNRWDGSQWNTYQFGTSAISAGSVTADLVAANAITAGLIAAGAIDGQTINSISIFGSTISAGNMIVSGTQGGLFVYSTGGTVVQTFSTNPTGSTWVCPLGITTVEADITAPGGGGAAGPNGGTNVAGVGGNSGEFASEPALGVTPGHSYAWSMAAPGTGGLPVGTRNGGDAGTGIFNGDSVAVTAHGGGGGRGAGTNGPLATGSANTRHRNGALGWINPSIPNQYGGGGASPPSATVAGRNGNGNYGAPAVVGGAGPGGNGFGGGPDGYSGLTPYGYGGGGGGGANNSARSNQGADGAPGLIKITYTAASPVMLASIAGAATFDPEAGQSVPAGLYLLGGTPVSFQGVLSEDTHATISAPAGRQLQLSSPKTLSSDIQAQLLVAGAVSTGQPRLSFNGLSVPVLSAAYPSGSTFQGRANTTTLTFDNILQVQVLANAVYTFECQLIYSGGAAGATNFQFSIGSPSGTEADWFVPLYFNTSNVRTEYQTSYSSGVMIAYCDGVAASAAKALSIFGTMYTGSSGGTAGLYWAQGTSSGTTTRLWSGSRISFFQIG